MSISRRKRFSVFERDRFTCQYCGRRPPTIALEIDHSMPRSAGGSDDEENLITSCFDCNRGKAANLVIPLWQDRISGSVEAGARRIIFIAHRRWGYDEELSQEATSRRFIGLVWAALGLGLPVDFAAAHLVGFETFAEAFFFFSEFVP